MNRIKCIRVHEHLSQAAFGKLFNVDQTAVSNWENGKNSIDIKIAENISKTYSLPMDFIYGAPFELAIPTEKWHKSLIDDLNNAPEVTRDIILFREGKGYFHHSHINDAISQGPAVPVLAPSNEEFKLSKHEIAVISAYRNNIAMQAAVDKLLGIPPVEAGRGNIIVDDVFKTINDTSILPPIAEHIDTK
jgi:transcriptional regulator with XRE-family HTH domain